MHKKLGNGSGKSTNFLHGYSAYKLKKETRTLKSVGHIILTL